MDYTRSIPGRDLDLCLTFKPHISRVAVRVVTIMETLGKIIPNISGSTETKRRILCTVVESIDMGVGD